MDDFKPERINVEIREKAGITLLEKLIVAALVIAVTAFLVL